MIQSMRDPKRPSRDTMGNDLRKRENNMPAFLHRVFAAVMLIACGNATAEGEEPTLSPQEAQEGFSLLFNGKDLTGFKEVQGLAGAFHVEEGGVLAGRREGGKAYWLSTEKMYGDFELRLEYSLSPMGNSGIFLRVPHYLGRSSVLGMEVQLLDDGDKTGTPGKGDTGAIYRVGAATKFVSRPAPQWNELAVRCEGDRIQITLNGELINDFDMSKHEETKDRPREGYLGLSAHTDVVRFRNIRIKDLSPAPMP